MSDNFEKKEPEIDTDPGDDSQHDFEFEDNLENTGADYQKKLGQVKDKLKEAEEKAAKYLDNWQRDKAEFVNIRKRDEAAKEDFLKFANEKLILEVVVVLDHFDNALKHVDGEAKKGIELIQKELVSVLEKNGVKKFSPLGEAFDPAKAQAIALVPGEENKVAEVIQDGYELNGKVIRPAMVKVGEK